MNYSLLWFHGTVVEMADKLRDNGKIFVVVAVIMVLLIGVFLYLIRLDRKFSKLERSIKNDAEKV